MAGLKRSFQPGLITAIDPGNELSAYATIDPVDCAPVAFGKHPNHDVLTRLYSGGIRGINFSIEMVASYGMPVGKDVFETCVWIGRFTEALASIDGSAGSIADRRTPGLVYRRDVKMHHCHSAKAKDSNVRQALVDRFAKGERNFGKGLKDAPGWFYGFSKDVWQAYAVAVYMADTRAGGRGLRST